MIEHERGRSPERQLLDLIGLAARAGRIVAGTDAVRQGVRQGEVAVVLLAADASPTQHAKLIPLLKARNVSYKMFASRGRLGHAVGRGPVSAVGVADANFARRASALLSALPVSHDSVQEEV